MMRALVSPALGSATARVLATVGIDDRVAVLVPILAVGLALVHLFAGKLRFLEVIPRSRWLSMAGGASVAYVFVHVLPEVSEGAETVERSGIVIATFSERHVYLIALLGFVLFYGLERMAKRSQSDRSLEDGERTPSAGVFWIHIGSFAVYSGLIGYLLLHRESPGTASLLFFAAAMGLHFVVNDFGLREHHRRTYDRVGRWILGAAVVIGAAIGYAIEIDEAAVAVLFSFLAGGVVLNVIKEELPEERESRFWAFALGGLVYTALLLAV